MKEIHKSVMLKEVLHYLEPKEKGIYVDGTFGIGGHSRPLLEKIKDGKLVAFEWDKNTVNFVQQDNNFLNNPHFMLINDNFVNLTEHLERLDIKLVDGFLFDLGLSSYQLAMENRGFSYRLDSPLDMRISQETNLTATEIINNYSQEKLADIFFYYGEEQKARTIARKICYWRKNEKITTTQQLVKIVASCFSQKKNKHPARKIFQALRIFINKELTNLTAALEDAINYLAIGGRIVVISYHSLEDRIVKQIFKKYSQSGNFGLLTNKPLVPNFAEIENNHRARSAKMRVLARIN